MTTPMPLHHLLDLMIAEGPGAHVPSAVLIDLDQGFTNEQLDRLAMASIGAPRVIIGIAREPLEIEPRAFDLLLCNQPSPPRPWVSVSDLGLAIEGSTTELIAYTTIAELTGLLVNTVNASPGAAFALMQLLRSGESLTAADAVVAESWVYSLLQTGPRYAQWLGERTRRSNRPEPGGDVVTLRRDGDTLHITLDRPEVRNAFSARLRDELVAALELVSLDPSIARVELRGRGRAFSSGGDLGEFGTAPDPITAHVIRTSRSVGLGLDRHRARITTYVHGTCVGAGVELPAFTDTVVAHPDTTFRLPEVAMGVVPGAGGTSSIPRRIGRHRTAAFALSGLLIDAQTALRWGLVDYIDAEAFDLDTENADG
jgi:enoyl-CoA hydratase/carnithine racemase